MEIIPFRHELQARPVQIRPIQMFVIRILVLFPSVGQEVNHPVLFIHLDNLVYMPGPLRNTVLQVPVSVIQVQMCPSVPFTPMNHLLASVQDSQRTYLLVGVHALFDKRTDGIFA